MSNDRLDLDFDIIPGFDEPVDEDPPEHGVDTSAYDYAYVPFGVHRDKPLLDVAKEAPDYLSWMLQAAADGFFTSLRIRAWIEDNEDLIREAPLVAAKLKIAEAPEIILTEHQQSAVDKILALLADGFRIVRLEGGAGYGKSFAVRKLSEALILMGHRVHGMAISYVATEVLRSHMDPVGATCGTVAKSLKFNKTFHDGVEDYEFSDDSPTAAKKLFENGGVVVLDECSMGDDVLADWLFDHCLNSDGILILVGDSAQLPPVKQDTLSKFCGNWSNGVVALTEPMRYSKDSLLYQVERAARYDPASVPSYIPQAPTGETSVVHKAVEFFAEFVATYKEHPDASHRMLLFRRQDVTDANATIRDAIQGPHSDAVVEDEPLMVISTSDFPYARTKEERVDQVRHYSGETFQCTRVDIDTYAINIGGRSYEVPHYVATFAGRERSVNLMFGVSDTKADETKLGGREYAIALSAARVYANKVKMFQRDWQSTPLEDQTREQKTELALLHGVVLDGRGEPGGAWDAYRQLTGDFVKVAYCYATTVHRAQGQTVDYAYCVPSTLSAVGGLMGHALGYVAMTRARKHLTILV